MLKPVFLLVLLGWTSSLRFVSTELPQDHLQNVHKKFEFKYSFKPPMLVNSKGSVPFWEHGGDTIPTDSQIRICPSIQDRRGFIVARNLFDKPNWMVDVEFSITGKHLYGADGMAFWYTSSKIKEGSVFGNSPDYVGLGVFIDTFDNDGMGDSPKIGIYINNGSLRFNQGNDGKNQDQGHCIKYIRNKRYGTKVKIVYFQKLLEVWVHEGDNEKADDYSLCARLNDVSLPDQGYFGVSAATGGLSDDHDVQSFLVHSLINKQEHTRKMVEKFDQKRTEQMQFEYEKRSQTFDTKKSQYHKEHEKDEYEWERRMEMDENIQQIFAMHHTLNQNIRGIKHQLDTLASNPVAQVQGSVGGASDSTVLASEGRLSHQIQELKSQFGRSTREGSNLPTSEQLQPIYEMKELVKGLLVKVDDMNAKLQSTTGASDTSCLSTWFFVLALFLQSGLVIIFLLYKHSQERNAKKFF